MSGRIEVIVGGMFAGKSDELIRRLRRAEIARQRVLAFKPAVDTRYGDGIVSHDGVSFRALTVPTVGAVLLAAADADVVGIDEAQFFDGVLIRAAEALASAGKRVIVAGLDTDYRGDPFGPVPALMAIADDVLKLHAVCTSCGEDAVRSQRIVASQDQVLVGAETAYEARCRAHWNPEPVFSRRESVGEIDG